MTRKALLALCLSTVSGLMVACSIPEEEVAVNNGSVKVYTAREIVTLDPENPQAEAVAVEGNKIVAVGSVAAIKQALPGRVLDVDSRFADKVLVPGLINQHDHPWLAALTMSTEIIAIEDWELPGKTYPRAVNSEEYRQRLQAVVETHWDSQEVLYSWGYHRLWHGDLSRADLDSISTTVPIVIWQRSGHEFIFNTRALETFGIDRTTVDQFPEGSKAQSNWDKGHFWEQGAMALVPMFFKAMAAPERFIPALEMVKDYWHAAGSTLVVEPGGLVNKDLQAMQNRVFGPADTPFHMDYIADGKTMAYQHMDGDIIGETEKLLSWGEGMSRFIPKQIKLFTDGAMFGQLMQMKDGYLDGHHGEWIIDPDRFEKAFKAYWDAGYQIHVHQNGDAGLDVLLDVVEANLKRNPREDHRTVVVHFGFSTPEQVQRIADLGVIVSANPYYIVALADTYSEVGVGYERAQQMVRLGDLARAGISFSLHSDMPMAPGKPLFLMWSAVNRTTLEGNTAGPNQRISAEQALRAVTLDAAYSMQMDSQLGSIEVGKLANLTVLAENPLTVDPETIKDIEVWGTLHEGRVLPVMD